VGASGGQSWRSCAGVAESDYTATAVFTPANTTAGEMAQSGSQKGLIAAKCQNE
jgi:hypothetical protein